MITLIVIIIFAFVVAGIIGMLFQFGFGIWYRIKTSVEGEPKMTEAQKREIREQTQKEVAAFKKRYDEEDRKAAVRKYYEDKYNNANEGAE
ncbi:MAG: hypothetical protein FWG12_06185 [Holophagaceae bacterium]|nr:hypothetical protein [Holophagaceae bacterium]